MEIREVAVIGLRTMGAGIVEVLAFAPAALLGDHATAGLAFHPGGWGQ
jgi:hypothetical protein